MNQNNDDRAREAAARASELVKYASTQNQAEALNAVVECGSIRGAARLLKKNERAIRQYIRSCEINRARGDKAAHFKGNVPDGYAIKGVSTLLDRDGEQAAQWVKVDADKKLQGELLMQSLVAALESYKGCSEKYNAPKVCDSELLAVYPFGDPHIGMYSWATETGADFDCDIAERSMIGAVDYLCDASPPAGTAIVLSVGDTFHCDNKDNKSLNHGHSFDIDTRWSRVLEIGVKIMIRCIDRALQKHKKVIFKAMKGNHDWHGADALGIALKLFYANNQRVTVDTGPAYYWYHKHGEVLIGATHGNTCKPELLPAVMADDVHEWWGQTKHRYWYTGHVHNHQVKEFRGVTFESFRTLAARDAWHAEKGYKSGRDMYAIIHDSRHGEIYRHRCDISKLAIC